MVDSKTLTKNRRFYFLALLVLTAFLSPRIAAQSQPATPNVDPAISKLAAKIAEPLQKAGATKVVVTNLRGPDGQTHPVGKWLADQLSASLKNDFPNLVVVVRPPGENAIKENEDSASSISASAEEKDWARKLRANTIINGSFAKAPHGIGVSLSAASLVDSVSLRGHTDGLVPITGEITALSPDPIPAPKGGIARAGIGGTSVPSCTHCPAPTYTDKARAAKYQGTIVLQVTVSAEGRTKNVLVTKGPGLGLEERAIESVRRWKFKPALDTDGNAVDAIVPIEITFRLY